MNPISAAKKMEPDVMKALAIPTPDSFALIRESTTGTATGRMKLTTTQRIAVAIPVRTPMPTAVR